MNLGVIEVITNALYRKAFRKICDDKAFNLFCNGYFGRAFVENVRHNHFDNRRDDRDVFIVNMTSEKIYTFF